MECGGIEVSRLLRVRYGPIELPPDMRPGAVRRADEALVDRLDRAAGGKGLPVAVVAKPEARPAPIRAGPAATPKAARPPRRVLGRSGPKPDSDPQQITRQDALTLPPRKSEYAARFRGGVPKRPTGADCKSAGLRLRRFESFPLHHTTGGVEARADRLEVGGCGHQAGVVQW